ncbi:MAG TPA: DUF2934 domain-containing protein [Xanthobacteraceae bacterium]|jgi:hypothetical protein|nr:DUF2934 domain-containing protein [Xanthobacteraceae bacterium]
MEQTLELRIRQRAYEIWHANGCAEGKSDEHWLAAEREVLASSCDLFAAPAAAVTPTAKKTNRATRRAAKAAKSPAAA